MRRLMRIFNQIMGLARRRRREQPQDIPKKLPPEALAQALSEARFLKANHAVDVKSLQAGEQPGKPQRADQ
jgi:hypothetical protein